MSSSNPIVAKVSPADLWANATDLVTVEQESKKLWRNWSDYEQALMLDSIRKTLIRLLKDPSWVDGSLKAGENDQIHVTFVVDLQDIGFRIGDDALLDSLRDILDSTIT